METENIFIVHPTAEQEGALKAFVKALKIRFVVAKERGPYHPDFVSKIRKSQKEFEQGHFTRLKKDDLKKYLGVE
jgi:hypothetical protein